MFAVLAAVAGLSCASSAPPTQPQATPTLAELEAAREKSAARVRLQRERWQQAKAAYAQGAWPKPSASDAGARIDGSTPERYRATLAAVRSSVPEERRDVLDIAMAEIVSYRADQMLQNSYKAAHAKGRLAFTTMSECMTASESTMGEALNGMTEEQIIWYGLSVSL